ncbi:hypothetical protein ACWGM0_11115 [Sphingomonas bisphenolicum]
MIIFMDDGAGGVVKAALGAARFPRRHAEFVSASIDPSKPLLYPEEWTLKQVQGDDAYIFASGR